MNAQKLSEIVKDKNLELERKAVQTARNLIDAIAIAKEQIKSL